MCSALILRECLPPVGSDNPSPLVLSYTRQRSIVFHTLNSSRHLVYAGSLQYPFQPSTMFSVHGRLYHPAPAIGTCSHALLSNSLTLQLMAVSAILFVEICRMNLSSHDVALVHFAGIITSAFLQFAAPTESGIVMNIPEHDPVVIEERLA